MLIRILPIWLLAFPLFAFSTDNANLPVPPLGWDAVKSVPHGEVKRSLPYSTRNNGQQLYSIWLPPGYSTAQKYPVLYMHHGLTDDQTTWINGSKGKAHNILDNLLADKKIVPMLVVFPDGAVGDQGDFNAFGKFGDLLLNDLIPYIGKTYSASNESINRAIGGLSMGGRLNGKAPQTGLVFESGHLMVQRVAAPDAGQSGRLFLDGRAVPLFRAASF